uniref:USP domain-containing protein n=2 Tax=Aegilops tauschii subsp. strangulata TaxID=200361 RepID=A0A452XGK4_AEGTS
TCFVNCILQCVVHTVPLVLKLQKDDHTDACPGASGKFCCYCSLKVHADEVISLSGAVLYPKKFVEHLKLFSENFRRGRHQDAHEFLRCLLDKLDEASVPPRSPSSERPSSIVTQVFGGQLKSQLHCPECNYCSDRLEPFLDLNLEVIPMATVMDALKSFTKIEVFENYGCDGCKSRVNMEKQLKVEQAPEVLVIQLKRFQNFGSHITKIEDCMMYQEELDLNPFMSSPDNKPQKYDLYGVVEHEGAPSNGHYVCYIRSSRTNWFHFNDSKVMKINDAMALESEAYLLFYAKQGSSPWFSTLLKR